MKIILGGDLMIGRMFNEYLEKFPLCANRSNKCYIFGDTKDIIKPDDLFCVNLETTLTDSDDKYPDKVFNYKLKPNLAGVLNTIGIDYCALANNHILDFKQQGLEDTINTLDKLKIKHSGAGKNYIKPAFFNNGNIAIFSVSDHFLHWKGQGVFIIDINSVSEVLKLKEIIEKESKNAKFRILFMHWGANFLKTPTNAMKITANLLLQDGTVNIIAGTSSHHIQKIEKINNGIVFYGLGSYLDDFAVNEEYRSYLGILAKLEIDGNYNLKKFEIIPTKINKREILQVNVAKEQNDIDFINKTIK